MTRKGVFIFEFFVAITTATLYSLSTAEEENKFCSRTHVQESVVRYEKLRSGELLAHAHIMLALRTGDTVCLRAVLKNQTNSHRYDEEFTRRTYNKQSLSFNSTGSIDVKRTEELNAPPQTDNRRTRNISRKSIISLEQENSVSEKSIRERYKQELSNTQNHPTMAHVGEIWNSQEISYHVNADAFIYYDNPQNLQRNTVTEKNSISIPGGNTGYERKRTKKDTRQTVMKNNAHQHSLLVKITAESLRFHHKVISSYKFVEPRMNVSCTCACSTFHKCDDCDAECVSFAPASQHVADCADSLLGAAHTCCHVQLSGSHTFTAVELSTGEAVVKLTLSSLASGSETPQYKTVHVSVGGETHVMLAGARVQVTTTGLTGIAGGNPLAAGWYILHNGQLYSNDHLNRPSEYSLSKLGWLKTDGQVLLIPSANRLKDAISVDTKQCTQQQFQVRANMLLDAVEPQLGDAIQLRGFSHIDSNSHVTIESQAGNVIWLSVRMEQVEHVRYLIDHSFLTDFKGIVKVDNRSQTSLHINLINSTGMQFGSLIVENESQQQPPTLYHFSWSSENTRKMNLPVTLPKAQQQARVCLRPDNVYQPSICHQLHVLRQTREQPRPDTLHKRHLLTSGRTNSMNTIEKFIRALNPAGWLRSGGGWSTAVGATVDGVLIVLIIAVGWRCFTCCLSCVRFNRKKA